MKTGETIVKHTVRVVEIEFGEEEKVDLQNLLEEKFASVMNEMGKVGWECFAMEDMSDGDSCDTIYRIMYFKRCELCSHV